MTAPPAARPASALVLGVLRTAVGAGSLAVPRASATAFGLDPDRSSGWVLRLFASRELALAGALLSARDPQRRRAVAQLGAAVDALDAVSSLVEWRRGRISGWTMVSGGLGAVFFALLGLDTARRA